MQHRMLNGLFKPPTLFFCQENYFQFIKTNKFCFTDKTNYRDQQRKLFYNSQEVLNWSRSVGGLQRTFELIIVTLVSAHGILIMQNVVNTGNTMDRLYNGMKRSSSESATNATREPETMFSNVAPESVQPKPWKQRFSFRQPRKQQPIEEVCWSHSLTMSCQNVITAVSVSINVNQFTR